MDFCFSGVCYEKKLLVVPVNTSFLAEVTYTEMQNCLFCLSLSHPFKREVTKRKLVPIFRLENVTKVVSQPGCCEGWARAKKVAQEIECEPVCSEGCGQESQVGHGTCSAPFTCTCDKVSPSTHPAVSPLSISAPVLRASLGHSVPSRKLALTAPGDPPVISSAPARTEDFVAR